MVQGGKQIGFAREPRQPFGIVRKELGQNLESDVSHQVAVASPVDFSHAAGANERGDLVGSKADAGREAHDVREIISSPPLMSRHEPIQPSSRRRAAPQGRPSLRNH